jgi:Transposase, Mutator family
MLRERERVVTRRPSDNCSTGWEASAAARSVPGVGEEPGMREWAAGVVTVAAVARAPAFGGVGFVAQVIGHLELQPGLENLADQSREQPVVAGQLHTLGPGPLDQLSAMVATWETAWPEFVPFLEFPVELRKLVYTTNAIESLNARFRRAVRHRGHFPTSKQP